MTPRLGLALGGGAARGLAHLGVLDALREAGVRPDIVVGTSFGALMAAATLCRRGDAREVERSACGFVEGEAFRRSKLAFLRRQHDVAEGGASYSVRDAIRRGLEYGPSAPDAQMFPVNEMRAAFRMLVPDIAIESLGVQFGAVAADLETGEELLFDRGSLRLAVEASSAIPGLLPPVRVAGRLCVDGGWVEKVPVRAARSLGADFVIAVDVAAELADSRGLLEGAGVVHRADAVQAARFKATQLANADAVIACDVARFGWADFAHARDLAQAGREAAQAALPRVQEQIERAGGCSGWLRRIAAGFAATRMTESGGGHGALEIVHVRAAQEFVPDCRRSN